MERYGRLKVLERQIPSVRVPSTVVTVSGFGEPWGFREPGQYSTPRKSAQRRVATEKIGNALFRQQSITKKSDSFC